MDIYFPSRRSCVFLLILMAYSSTFASAYVVRFKVISCSGLPDRDGCCPNTDSDPYPITCFPAGSSPGCQTGSRKNDDHNPVFNYQYDFTISSLSGTLTLQIMDYDSVNSDDDLGTISYGYNLAGQLRYQTLTYTRSLPTGSCQFSLEPRDFGFACTVGSSCSGHASAASGVDTSGCSCTCLSNYQGGTCASCASGYDTYPNCYRTCTNALDCASHASSVSGNVNSGCSCTCSTGFTGSTCNSCAAGYEDYPNCYRTCTNALDCSSHSTAVSGNVNSGCSCTCLSNYQGGTCASCASGYDSYPNCYRTCTNALDCTSHASSVSGNVNSGCSCSCSTGFGGSSCNSCAAGYEDYPNCYRTCTSALDCSGHAATVSGNVNSGCTCSCTASSTQAWAGSTCNACSAGYEDYPSCWRTCTNALDCNNHATGVSDHVGNGCVCTCQTNFQGATCNQCSPGFHRYHNGCETPTKSETESDISFSKTSSQSPPETSSRSVSSTLYPTKTLTHAATMSDLALSQNVTVEQFTHTQQPQETSSPNLGSEYPSATLLEVTSSSDSGNQTPDGSSILGNGGSALLAGGGGQASSSSLAGENNNSTAMDLVGIASGSSISNLGATGDTAGGADRQIRSSGIFGFETSSSLCLGPFIYSALSIVIVLLLLAFAGHLIHRREQQQQQHKQKAKRVDSEEEEEEVVSSPYLEDATTTARDDESTPNPPPLGPSLPLWIRAPLWRSLFIHHRWLSLFLLCHGDCALTHGLLAASHLLTLLWSSAALVLAVSSRNTEGVAHLSQTATVGVVVVTLLFSQTLRPLLDFYFYTYSLEEVHEEGGGRQVKTSDNKSNSTTTVGETHKCSLEKSKPESLSPTISSRKAGTRAYCFNQEFQNSMVYLDQIGLSEQSELEMNEVKPNSGDPMLLQAGGTIDRLRDEEDVESGIDEEKRPTAAAMGDIAFSNSETDEEEEEEADPSLPYYPPSNDDKAAVDSTAFSASNMSSRKFSATTKRRQGLTIVILFIVLSSVLCISLGTQFHNKQGGGSDLCFQYEKALIPCILILDAVLVQPLVIFLVFIYRRFFSDDEVSLLPGVPGLVSCYQGLHPQDCCFSIQD